MSRMRRQSGFTLIEQRIALTNIAGAPLLPSALPAPHGGAARIDPRRHGAARRRAARRVRPDRRRGAAGSRRRRGGRARRRRQPLPGHPAGQLHGLWPSGRQAGGHAGIASLTTSGAPRRGAGALPGAGCEAGFTLIEMLISFVLLVLAVTVAGAL